MVKADIASVSRSRDIKKDGCSAEGIGVADIASVPLSCGSSNEYVMSFICASVINHDITKVMGH
jgi:hypothetical protein